MMLANFNGLVPSIPMIRPQRLKRKLRASAATLQRWGNARIYLQGNSPNRFTQAQTIWLAKRAQKNFSSTNFVYGWIIATRIGQNIRLLLLTRFYSFTNTIA